MGRVTGNSLLLPRRVLGSLMWSFRLPSSHLALTMRSSSWPQFLCPGNNTPAGLRLFGDVTT